MTCTGPYFLFFCRGFKLVGPMVIMVYRMLAQDIVRSGNAANTKILYITPILIIDPDLDLSSLFS